jgi:topoisomerase-4 subunit A
VLSKRGWVRAAKGHDIDPESLNYREGDGYFASAPSRNNQNAVFFDSKGKAYTLPCHSLPSARGQGEPLTGKLNAESGETFAGVISGPNETKIILATSSGYGFIANLGDLQTKNKSGKAAIRVQANAAVLPPSIITGEEDLITAITNQGRMLVFPHSELPQLARGKGNKIIGIPKANFDSGEEFLQEIGVMGEGRELKLISGKRHFTIKFKDLENFLGNRGRRGNFLPKGFRKVDGIEVISPQISQT